MAGVNNDPFACLPLEPRLLLAGFVEDWQQAAPGNYTPISSDTKATMIHSGTRYWNIGDTASEDGPSPNRAQIATINGSMGLRLHSPEQSGAANVWAVLADFQVYNRGFSVPFNTKTVISFSAAGFLQHPEAGSPHAIFRPYGDTVSLEITTDAGDEVAYILNRAPDRTPDADTRHYHEVFLDPAAGQYSRNLYQDLSAAAGFDRNASIASINFSLGDVGWATLDNLRIGGSTTSTPAPTGKSASKLVAPKTGASGYTFKVAYTGSPALAASTIGSGDILVAGPNGFKQFASLVSKTPGANSARIVATYTISAPGGSWNSADKGVYTFTLRPNQVKTTSGKAAAQTTLGSLRVG